MITFSHHNTRFNYRIAAVALHEGNVLLNKLADHNFWFLPGGRAELLEPSHQTLKREMREELGIVQRQRPGSEVQAYTSEV